ncbi:MAG: hypothetical protein HY296_06485 [Thaumarchaeota archaeon]|nr:hypothetical protein [Nitrososphaerota archaeon]
MVAWREETSSDLRNAKVKILKVLPAVSGELTSGQVNDVWGAYLLVEKSVFFIRVEIDEESPGRFISSKMYSVPDERQALRFALKNLEAGSEEFALGDFTRSLKALRESRNYLRVLIKTAWRRKARKGRGSVES